MRRLQLLTMLTFLMALPGRAGILWLELNPAGNLPATAQSVTGFGAVDQISGNLSALIEVDMYRFRISNPLQFSAKAVDNTGFAVADPQMFLFNATGFGVYSNDEGNGTGSQSFLEAGHPLGPVSVGVYFLAIGWWNNEPFSSSGAVFTDGFGTNGPDAVGGVNPVIGWDNNVSGRIDLPTDYAIELTGVEAVPEPATWWLAGLGLGFGALRRFRARGKR